MQEQVTSLGASPRRNRPTGVELKVEGVGHLGVGWAWGVAGAAVNFDNLPNFGLHMCDMKISVGKHALLQAIWGCLTPARHHRRSRCLLRLPRPANVNALAHSAAAEAAAC